MATKINDISSSLMTNALSTMKEAKSRKAEAAFQSFLNSAVSGNSAQDTTGFQCLSAESGKTDYSYDDTAGDMDKVSELNTAETAKVEKNNVEAPDDTQEMTDIEKADKVIDELAEEMGISREELMDNYEELLNSIAAILMEKFNVTEEQLNLVLDNLGLTLTDMFHQTDLMSVVMALSGVEDISAVLTDENLYVQIQEVVQELTLLKDGMLSDNQMSLEQLKVLENSIEVVESAEAEEPVIMKDTVQQAHTDEVTVAKQEPVLEVISDKHDSSMNHSQGQQMMGQEAFQQFTGRVAEQVQQLVNTNGSEFVQQTDMEAIIQQVTEHVKMQVQADTTSLEMQLHPESYGKLNLQVSVRDGVVTAKLAVENELVRQALENQIVQLREDMSERGLKVDAVEVAIASHEFERNLEEGQENNQASHNGSDTTRRQINLREEGMSLEEIAAMTEAEALTRKIMLENGNSIDFSA